VLNRFREAFKPLLERIAEILARLGLEPHEVSLLGLVLACLSACLFYNAPIQTIYAWYGLLFFAVSALVDALDGALARRLGKVSEKGAFLDSLIDRLVEVIIVFGLLGGMATIYPALLYIATSLIISYTRAKAEALGLEMAGIGFMERAERLIFLMIGILLWILDPSLLDYVLIIISGLNIVTIFQRTYYAIERLGRR